MNWFSRFLITILLSIGVAAALTFLFRLDESSAVFRTMRQAEPVTDANIVDVLSATELHLRIRRVEVSRATVSVDLLAASATDAVSALQDLVELPRHLFTSSTNIHQVLVRVLDGSQRAGGSAALLAAVDARREKWTPTKTPKSKDSAEELKRFLDTYYRVTYMPRWQERFGSAG
ncbi:hypothetical protein [Paenibacillus ginsengihumi]|uniref:hypothetical protein n=1 Tax=Paenibacillus ginsengihumi TaxID=431596 RepID=UPI00037F75C3|nr:hypothetical protein [Paenibacillus ginsengihumi]